MGFTTGLLGGLTLTTGIFYLSLSYHRANRLSQAMLIRQNTLVLNHLSSGSEFLRRDPSLAPRTPPLDPSSTLEPSLFPTDSTYDDDIARDPASLYGSRRKQAALRDREAFSEERRGVVGTAKETWNAQIEKWVRRVQNTDFGVLRESAEERLGMLYGYARQEAKVLEKKAEERAA